MYYTDDPVRGKKVRIDLTGKSFGRLTVVEYSHTNKHGVAMWKCKCDCGNERIVAGAHLRSGHTTSCGCFNLEAIKKRATKHGLKQTRLYNTWLHIKDRCLNSSNKDFEHYGGRGIKVCREWADNFETFYKWAINNGYNDKLTIDRINVNGDYCPENCRWVTQKKQCNNKRSNVFLEYNGETHTLKEWSEITGICYQTIHGRYRKGKTPAEILRTRKAAM